jgi:Amt family ammonium transporter
VIAPALVSGSFVGRMRFKPYVLFIILWSLLVYIPIAHWVWGTNGWLNKLHVLDFAGGLVVHINAGVSGLIAAAMLGPRMYLKRKAVTAAHNIPFVLLGCGLLWFGWFGFNAGSALAANQIAALAFITTLLAPAACMLVWVLLCWLTQRPSSASGAAFATVAGLVAITPACGYVTPLSAILIGTCTAVVCYFVLYYKRILRLNKIDDTLDVFTCHGVGGVVGSLLVGVLATQTVNATGENGLLYGNPQQLWIQFIATAAVILYCALATALILWLLKTFIQVRPDPITEHKGIDVTEHGESAYTQD